MLDTIRDLALRWYIFTNSLSSGATPAFQALEAQIAVPLISALLLGVLGAAAPCQLTQSVGMLAILGRRGVGMSRWHGALAYLAGKALVYSTLDVLAVVLGADLAEVSIPVFVTVRKVLGSLMIIVGLAMVGALHWSWVLGSGLASQLRTIAHRRSGGAPFLLGVAFGFAFCPTLFTLFVGLLIPLALARPDGMVYPAAFALGTVLPMLGILGLLSLGGGAMQQYARSIGRGQQIVGVLAGVLLIGIGLNDTVVYWLW